MSDTKAKQPNPKAVRYDITTKDGKEHMTPGVPNTFSSVMQKLDVSTLTGEQRVALLNDDALNVVEVTAEEADKEEGKRVPAEKAADKAEKPKPAAHA